MSAEIARRLVMKFEVAKEPVSRRYRTEHEEWLKANSPATLVRVAMSHKALESAWNTAKADPMAEPSFDFALAAWAKAWNDAIDTATRGGA